MTCNINVCCPPPACYLGYHIKTYYDKAKTHSVWRCWMVVWDDTILHSNNHLTACLMIIYRYTSNWTQDHFQTLITSDWDNVIITADTESLLQYRRNSQLHGIGIPQVVPRRTTTIRVGVQTWQASPTASFTQWRVCIHADRLFKTRLKWSSITHENNCIA